MSPLNIFVIVILVVLIYMFLKYLFSDPYTLSNIIDGTVMTTISPSSLAKNETEVPSNNFAYSIWFYVNDWNYKYGESKVIFGRMGSQSESTPQIDKIGGVDPCPLVVLGALENNINVTMSCYPGAKVQASSQGSLLHSCQVGNIPLQKWVHLLLSVYGRTMDIYIDGKLVRTCVLPGVAKINNNSNVYITPGGGFKGWTSKFQYYPNSLNPQEVWNTYVKGYGGGWFSNILSSYSVQLSVIEDGTTKTSITI
jgi:hypothetical protein